MQRFIYLALCAFIFVGCTEQAKQEAEMALDVGDAEMTTEVAAPDSLLRHVVLFSFKETSSAADIKLVEEAFHALPAKIDAIYDYEWGLNNSPEGLDKGFTHAFFLSFRSEADRAIYLPHPDHKAFGEVLGPHLEDVLVVDYWAR